MVTLRATSCCGLGELQGITTQKDPKDALMDIGGRQFSSKRSFILFSCPTTQKHGKNLQEFIEREDLGKVTVSTSKKNPNSGNNLKIYLWEVDRRKFNKWFKERKPFEYTVGDRVKVLKVSIGMDKRSIGYSGVVMSPMHQTFGGTNKIKVAFEKQVNDGGNLSNVRVNYYLAEHLEYIKPE